MSDSLWPHGLYHARLPCPSLSPGVCSNSCPLNWWCFLTISSSALFAFKLSQHQGLFQWVGSLRQLAKYWNFSISFSSEYPVLISFRIDWIDLPEAQGTLKSLLQHHNSKVSVLWCPAFFMVQLSHLYIAAGKTIILTMDICWQSDVFAFYFLFFFILFFKLCIIVLVLPSIKMNPPQVYMCTV